MTNRRGFTPTPIVTKHKLNKQLVRGFTLMELLIVIIIIGTLATLAISHYASTKETVLDREAMANLKLIQGQERTFKVEMGSYYPVPPTVSESNIATINQDLVLRLPTGGGVSWNYAVWNNGCSMATRNGGDGRIWYLKIDNDGKPLAGTPTSCP